MSLVNSSIGNSLRKEFNQITEPKLPFKRKLTAEELKILYLHFGGHSWSHIDADGLIVLGGGEYSAGKFYITEEDLNSLM